MKKKGLALETIVVAALALATLAFFLAVLIPSWRQGIADVFGGLFRWG